jgi:hypothetical protein
MLRGRLITGMFDFLLSRGALVFPDFEAFPALAVLPPRFPFVSTTAVSVVSVFCLRAIFYKIKIL